MWNWSITSFLILNVDWPQSWNIDISERILILIHMISMFSHGPFIRDISVLLFQFHWNYFEFSYFWTQALLRIRIHDLVSRLGSLNHPPVLTSSFNLLKPPWSICQKSGQYWSLWIWVMIEIFKRPFWWLILGQVLGSIYWKKKRIPFRPCQGHFLL